MQIPSNIINGLVPRYVDLGVWMDVQVHHSLMPMANLSILNLSHVPHCCEPWCWITSNHSSVGGLTEVTLMCCHPHSG